MFISRFDNNKNLTNQNIFNPVFQSHHIKNSLNLLFDFLLHFSYQEKHNNLPSLIENTSIQLKNEVDAFIVSNSNYFNYCSTSIISSLFSFALLQNYFHDNQNKTNKTFNNDLLEKLKILTTDSLSLSNLKDLVIEKWMNFLKQDQFNHLTHFTWIFIFSNKNSEFCDPIVAINDVQSDISFYLNHLIKRKLNGNGDILNIEEFFQLNYQSFQIQDKAFINNVKELNFKNNKDKGFEDLDFNTIKSKSFNFYDFVKTHGFENKHNYPLFKQFNLMEKTPFLFYDTLNFENMVNFNNEDLDDLIKNINENSTIQPFVLNEQVLNLFLNSKL